MGVGVWGNRERAVTGARRHCRSDFSFSYRKKLLLLQHRGLSAVGGSGGVEGGVGSAVTPCAVQEFQT